MCDIDVLYTSYARAIYVLLGWCQVRATVPKEVARFEDIDKRVRELLMFAVEKRNVIRVCCAHGMMLKLEELHADLVDCERALGQ
jgi:hypothetical protein